MYYRQRMSQIATFCDTLGRKEIGQRLGVGRAAIANAVSDGRLPSRWYRVISMMCEERGVECPAELFNFVEPKDDEEEARQGAA